MAPLAPPSTPKFRRRAAARPDEVLDAALKLFVQNGFAATRVEDIARLAGISKGSVYLYFPSKQALMEGLVRRAITPIAEGAMAMIAGAGGDPRPVISMILRGLATRLTDPKILAVPKLILREAPSFPQIAEIYRNEVLAHAIPMLEGLVRRGVAEGYLRDVDPELTVRSIMGPVLIHILLGELFGISPKQGLCMEQLVENHLTILFDGLGAPQSPNATSGEPQ
jgi:AcrR family transcriptional regulator